MNASNLVGYSEYSLRMANIIELYEDLGDVVFARDKMEG